MMDLFFLFSNYRESGDESLTDCSLSTNNVTYDLIITNSSYIYNMYFFEKFLTRSWRKFCPKLAKEYGLWYNFLMSVKAAVTFQLLRGCSTKCHFFAI